MTAGGASAVQRHKIASSRIKDLGRIFVYELNNNGLLVQFKRVYSAARLPRRAVNTFENV